MSPTPEAIGSGLVQATERFAFELTTAQPLAPDWTDFEWRMARGAAVLHGVSALLAGRLRWAGPADWRQFLQLQHRQTLLRHRRIEAALSDIDRHAREQDLAVVALKGAALHALAVYAAGERPMADIDLLIREADGGRAAALLATLGYVETGATWKHRIFEPEQVSEQALAWRTAASAPPFGEHENYPIKVELHIRIAERLPVTEVDITAQIFPLHAQAGLNPYPSRSALFMHLLLHAAGSMSNRSLRLMHLHDIARLAAATSVQEWRQLSGMLVAARGLSWAYPPLALIDRYQPGLIPGEVLVAARRGCSWRLRRLCQRSNLSSVSCASVSIPAFPGLPWCSSLTESLRYLRQRILPDAEHDAIRKDMATELWAVRSSWTRMSHGRRVLHWLLGRPRRRAPLYIAQAALEQPPS
jgi:Uncharacterised nucleotidyltransferase